MKAEKWHLMVATWVVAGALYFLYMFVTGDRGVTGVAGLLLFVLIVLLYPRIADVLEEPVNERLGRAESTEA